MDLIVPQWFSKTNDTLTYLQIKDKLEYETAQYAMLEMEIQHTQLRMKELQKELNASS